MLTGIGYDALGYWIFLKFYNAHALAVGIVRQRAPGIGSLTKARLARPRSLCSSGNGGGGLKVEGEYSTRLIQTGH